MREREEEGGSTNGRGKIAYHAASFSAACVIPLRCAPSFRLALRALACVDGFPFLSCLCALLLARCRLTPRQAGGQKCSVKHSIVSIAHYRLAYRLRCVALLG